MRLFGTIMFPRALITFLLALMGTGCFAQSSSSQYQFTVIAKGPDAKNPEGTFIDDTHIQNIIFIFGLNEDGKALFSANTDRAGSNSGDSGTLFFGNKAVAYKGVVIDGITVDRWPGFQASMDANGHVIFGISPDYDKTPKQVLDKYSKEHYYPDYLVEISGNSEAQFLPSDGPIAGQSMRYPQRDDQARFRFDINGSKLSINLNYLPRGQKLIDQSLIQCLKQPIIVNWKKVITNAVEVEPSDSSNECIINQRGQILLSVRYWTDLKLEHLPYSALILGTPTNAPEPDVVPFSAVLTDGFKADLKNMH